MDAHEPSKVKPIAAIAIFLTMTHLCDCEYWHHERKDSIARFRVSSEVLSIIPGKPPRQDEAAAQVKEGEVDVVPALLADAQPLEVVEPGQRAFHHPPVSAEPLTRLDALAGDARDDSALPKTAPDVRVVVPLVTVSLLGPLPRTAAAPVVDWRDGVDEWQHAQLQAGTNETNSRGTTPRGVIFSTAQLYLVSGIL